MKRYYVIIGRVAYGPYHSRADAEKAVELMKTGFIVEGEW